jgi:nitrite reductase/ring-hydroxylating ferredoxin subunit
VKLPLCRLADLPDRGTRGFDLGPDADPREIFLYREGGKVFAYENACPHLGSPLEFTPDQFLAPDREHFQCSTHGALFRLEDGHCVSGPCQGQALSQLAVEIAADGQVLLVGED